MGIYRDPWVLVVTVKRGPVASEVAVELEYESGAGTVVIFEDWSPVPYARIPEWLSLLVDTVMRVGPLGAAAAAGPLADRVARRGEAHPAST